MDRKAYCAKIFFNWDRDEGIYGLGQAEEGIYNYRVITSISISITCEPRCPWLVSSRVMES